LELSAIFIILGWTLYLVYRVGQLNNAPIAIMGIGAYFSAYAVTHWGWPFLLAMAVAVLAGAAFALFPALGLGRAPSFAMVIATIALIFIMQVVFRNVPWFGGALGLFGIPKVKSLLPVTYVALVVIGILIYRFDHSRLGRAAEMVFVDREVAGTMGVNFYRFSVILQVATGGMGALAGVLYAFTLRTVIPTYFGFPLLLSITTFVFVGGYTSMWGAVVFTPILWGIPQLLPESFQVYRNIIYGVLLGGVLLLRSEGVIDRRLIDKIVAVGKKLFANKVARACRGQPKKPLGGRV
jgi:branched-chain amino acid transport system permease protein